MDGRVESLIERKVEKKLHGMIDRRMGIRVREQHGNLEDKAELFRETC